MSKDSSLIVGVHQRPKLSTDGRTLRIRIPFSLRRQGGRKQVVTPKNAAPWIPPKPRIDATLIKAIARGHRWLEMLESGRYATVRELAEAEKINESYLGRVLRLTLLSPELIQAILSGQQEGFELKDFCKPFPLEWVKQKQHFSR
jgi:hypothetical protein